MIALPSKRHSYRSFQYDSVSLYGTGWDRFGQVPTSGRPIAEPLVPRPSFINTGPVGVSTERRVLPELPYHTGSSKLQNGSPYHRLREFKAESIPPFLSVEAGNVVPTGGLTRNTSMFTPPSTSSSFGGEREIQLNRRRPLSAHVGDETSAYLDWSASTIVSSVCVSPVFNAMLFYYDFFLVFLV